MPAPTQLQRTPPGEVAGIPATTVIYASAVILPWIACYISLRSPALHATPAALNFALIAALSIFSELAPSLIAVFVTALAFNFYILPPSYAFSYSGLSLVHTIILLACGLTLVLFGQSRRAVDRELRAALLGLREHNDALYRAQRGSNSATWTFTTADRRTHWHEGSALIFGRSMEEVTALGSPVSLVHPEDWPNVAKASELTLQTGIPFNVTFRVLWPNGETHWLEARGTPDAEDPTLWRGVTVDITERKTAELALMQSEKLAAVGRLASTIAHEINNPLEAVTNLVYLARTDPNISPQGRGYLERADQELAHLTSITRRTLNFMRRKNRSATAEACAVMETICANYGPRIESRGGQLNCHCEPDTLHLPISSDELLQVLSNLVSNACDAIQNSDSGTIDVYIREEQDSVVVVVADDGAGISPDNLNRIFDPFFTTKESTGTGIGLWVTRELVENNGGKIYAHSGDMENGHKTVFRIEFPLQESANTVTASSGSIAG